MLLWCHHHPQPSDLRHSCTASSEPITEVVMFLLFVLSLYPNRPPPVYGSVWAALGETTSLGRLQLTHLHHTALCLPLSSSLRKSLTKADGGLKCFLSLCFPQRHQRDRLVQRTAQSMPLLPVFLLPLCKCAFSISYTGARRL